MKLTVVGSGDAFFGGGRGHACYLLEGAGDGPIMIDFGATALRDLRRLGREPNEVHSFLLTHLHGDHIAGIPFLVIDGMFNEIRTAKLEILGPTNTQKTLKQLTRICYGDVIDREKSFTLEINEIAPGESAELAGAKVEGFLAEHMGEDAFPLCLRITAKDGTVVAFSGDSAQCEGFRLAGQGADLFVAECTAIAPPCGKHTSFEEWQQLFDTIGAKRILLTHLGSDIRSEAEALQLPDHVSFADDGMVVTIRQER